jgi:sensor histidine kinase YesM
MRLSLVITFLFYLFQIALAQDEVFERISTKNGLPSSNVNDLSFDSKGYLWIATTNGLFRYDGYSFSSIIENTNVISIESEKKDGLYGKDGKSFFKLNSLNFNYTPILKLNYNDSFPNNDHYNNIFVDSKNNVWSCDFNFIKKYDIISKTLKQWKIFENSTYGYFAHFIEDENHQLWIATENGLYKYDEQNNQLVHVLKNFKFASIALSNGLLLLGTSDGRVLHYSINDNQVITSMEVKILSPIKFIIQEDESTYWLGMFGHLMKYNVVTKNIVEINTFKEQTYDFRKAVLDAKNDILWIATDAGLIKHRIGKSKEIKIINLPKSWVTYPIKIAGYVEIKQNQYFIALSKSGILEWNSATNAFASIPFATGDDYIKSISKSRTNDVYVAGGKGVYKVVNKMLIKIIATKKSIEKVIVDRQDRLWVIPYQSEIEVYNIHSLKKLSLWTSTLNAEYFKLNNFYDVFENTDGKIWLAGWFPKGYGISFYDEVKKTIVEVSEINNDSLFTGDFFYKISQQVNTSNLIFTGYGGFNKIDSTGKIIDRLYHGFTSANIKLPIIRECFIGSNGSHWMSSTEGLFYLSKDKKQLARISEYDGLSDNNISSGFLLTSDSKLLMSNTNQIELLDINQFIFNDSEPSVFMTSARILGKSKIINLENLIFERNENNLSFNFSTLSYNNPSQNNFHFREVGSSDWIDNGNSNNITFSNLAYGDHRFEVKVVDNLGNWTSKPFVFSFYIKPLIYEKVGFKIFLILLLLSSIIGFIVAKLSRIKKESENKLKLIEITNERSRAEVELYSTKQLLKSSQLDALRSQMNPHFIFNSLNSIENYILKNDRIMASEYLGKFSKLIRDILDNSKSEKITLAKEIETLQLYIELERIRNNNSFDVTINVSNQILDDNILVPPMLMQPHAENAILHGLRYLEGKKGQLTISMISINDEYLEYTLQDNGIGRGKSKELKSFNNYEHKSYGLDITQNRIDIFNHKNNVHINYQVIDLFDEDGAPCGTKVIINIPI